MRQAPARPRQSWEGAQLPYDPVGQANVLLYNQNLPASGTMQLDRGNFFFLFGSTAPVSVLFVYDRGHAEQMANVPTGTQVKRVKSWDRVILTGTGGTNVEFWHGYAFSREDQTNVQATIASITGTVLTTPGLGSSNSPTTHADVALATGTGSTIAANAARKMLIIGSLSTNAPATTQLRVGSAASAIGIELSAGNQIALPVSASVGVFNGDANAQTFWYVELT